MRSDAAPTRRPRSEHWVAPLEETPLQAVDAADTSTAPRSLWAEAGHSLVRNPVFVVFALLILFVLFVSAFPQVFFSQDSRYADLTTAKQPTGSRNPFDNSRLVYTIMVIYFLGL